MIKRKVSRPISSIMRPEGVYHEEDSYTHGKFWRIIKISGEPNVLDYISWYRRSFRDLQLVKTKHHDQCERFNNEL